MGAPRAGVAGCVPEGISLEVGSEDRGRSIERSKKESKYFATTLVDYFRLFALSRSTSDVL